MNSNLSRQSLRELQNYPLKIKEYLTADRIRELLRHIGHSSDGFYVSFSGGKDSEVAVDFTARTLAKLGYDKMHVLQINTGLEYTSVTNFCRPFCELVSQKYGIDVVLDVKYPQNTFKQVIEQYGYPVISKEVSQVIEEARKGIQNGDGTYERSRKKLSGTLTDKDGNLSPYNCEKYAFLLDAPFKISKHCCPVTKINPAALYEKETGRIPLIATLAQESRARETKWLRFGCNAFECDRPTSAPFSFWTENDVLAYIKREELAIAEAYGKIIPADMMKGQMNLFDIFNVKQDPEQRKWKTSGAERTGCCYCLFGIQFDPERILRMQKLEPKKADFVLRGGEFKEDGYFGPSKDGLGYWFILDYLKEHGIAVPYTDYGYRQSCDAA